MDHKDLPTDNLVALRERLLATVTDDVTWPSDSKQGTLATPNLPKSSLLTIKNCLSSPVALCYTSQPVTSDVPDYATISYYSITGEKIIDSEDVITLENYIRYPKQQNPDIAAYYKTSSKIECYFYIGHILLELRNTSNNEILTRKIIKAYGEWYITQKDGHITLEKKQRTSESSSRRSSAAAAIFATVEPSTPRKTSSQPPNSCGCTTQ